MPPSAEVEPTADATAGSGHDQEQMPQRGSAHRRPNRIISSVASELAREVRTTIQPEQWQEVLDLLATELGLRDS